MFGDGESSDIRRLLSSSWASKFSDHRPVVVWWCSRCGCG